MNCYFYFPIGRPYSGESTDVKNVGGILELFIPAVAALTKWFNCGRKHPELP
jgi:hypothetical protein